MFLCSITPTPYHAIDKFQVHLETIGHGQSPLNILQLEEKQSPSLSVWPEICTFQNPIFQEFHFRALPQSEITGGMAFLERNPGQNWAY